ncbi:putative retrotransposon gag domain-containing protein [Helianthus annuus]|nr:putative retrotransposon gag domain-containing protein [Helianthus annuus]
MAPKKDTSTSTTDEVSQPILDRLDATATHMTTQFAALHTTLNTALAALTEAISNLPTATAAAVASLVPPSQPPPNTTTPPNNPPPNNPPPNNPPPIHSAMRTPKIHLPTFDGSNPLDWVFQAENYFTFYNVPVNQRLAIVCFYFVGEALSWYKHLHNNHLLGTWPEFVRALELRFGPSTYENHQTTLFKLQQTTSVIAYQAEFEKISNRVVGLTPEVLKNCFISGLKQEIHSELALHHPRTLHDAYSIAKLLEDKFNAGLLDTNRSGSPPLSTEPTQTQSLLRAPSTSAQPLPIKKLTAAEMQTRRAAGLCFNCDERYQPGHRCQPPKFLFMQADTGPPWLGLEDKPVFEEGRIDTGP